MMSEEPAVKPSRMSGVAVLPWTVALVLFLLFIGVMAALWQGLTADPNVETETKPPEMTAAPPPANTPPPMDAVAPEPTAEAAQAAQEADAASMPEPVPPPVMEPQAEPEVAAAPPPPPVAAPVVSPEPSESVADTEAPGGPETAKSGTQPGNEVAAAPPVPVAEPVLPPPSPLMIPRSQRGSLRPAPDPGLVEPSAQGPLPRIGLDGREPWKVYARPYDDRDTRPRVAIILSGLGLSSAATEAAIQDLPSEVTLAYQPFADNIQQWIQLSRAAGHEVLLNLPMEPVDFPANDPGPRALFVTLSPDENQDRMRWALSRVSGYVGVVNHMGSRFTTSRDAMQPILAELKARGLLFVDARSAARSVATVLASEMQVPRAINDRFLDNREVSRATVDARLAEVERIAKDAGVSIAIGQAFPVTLERIRAWAATLEGKGIALVPISAVVDKQSDR